MGVSKGPLLLSDITGYFFSTELPRALTISAIVLVLLVILPAIIGTILRKAETYRLGERIPGPNAGGKWRRKSHRKAFEGGGGSVGDPTPFLSALHQEYGHLARFWLGKDLWVSVANPAYASAILETVLSSPAAVTGSLKSVLNREAMQLKPADDGKSLRLLLRKLFSGEVGANNPFEVIADAAAGGVQQVTNAWDAAVAEGKEVDALADALLMSSETLLRGLFGPELAAKQAKDYGKHLLRAAAGADRWSGRSFLRCVPFPSYWLWKASVFRLNEISWNLIAAVERTEGEKKAEAKLGDAPLKPPYSGGRGLDFIGHVAHSRTASGFPVIGSKRAMGDQITALVVGGTAPVASLLAWALYELARNPEAQRKAAQDVEAAIENGISTEETVWKADYLAAVLWETLRLHPPQPNIFRKLDSALKIGDIIIPAKTTIVIPVGAMQRDPKVWGPDAASFVPERFLRQTPARSSGEAEVVATKDVRPVGKEQLVLAFGEGLRACPGRSLALFEARAILSHLLENFEVTLSPGQTLSQSKVQGYVSLPLPSPKLLVKPRE